MDFFAHFYDEFMSQSIMSKKVFYMSVFKEWKEHVRVWTLKFKLPKRERYFVTFTQSLKTFFTALQ